MKWKDPAIVITPLRAEGTRMIFEFRVRDLLPVELDIEMGDMLAIFDKPTVKWRWSK